MSNNPREEILLWAVVFAAFALCPSGLVWWDHRGSSWDDRSWYAAFPPLTAIGNAPIAGAAGWLGARVTR